MTNVGVVVLSYNRPRWLLEALMSIQHAAQIVIADDGSDFDVDAVIDRADLDAPFSVVRNPPLTVDERMRTPRVGRLINRALERIETPTVTYLCDDDVFAPDWLPAIENGFRETSYHMVRGSWHVLGTEQDVELESWCITTGCFAHRTDCVHLEANWWSDQTVAVHDAVFLSNYFSRHQYRWGGHVLPNVGFAGWRREHEFNMMHWTVDFDYKPEAAAVIGGMLETEPATAARPVP